MKKILLTVTCVLCAVAFSFYSFSANAQEAILDMTLEHSDSQVQCNCAFLGGNKNCLSNNWGSRCGGGSNYLCQTNNSNCG